MNSDAQYEYANELLQTIGFADLADYRTLVKCDSIDDAMLDRVNSSIPQFRKLFKQREYNLSRYGYRLQKREHLLGLIKKLTSQLGIGYEIYRYKGENYLRLNPPNNYLERFIKKMQNVTTGSRIVQRNETSTEVEPISSEAVKTKKMSDILKEYGNTDKRTKEYYFYDVLYLHDIVDIADVVMSITSKTPFTVTIGIVPWLKMYLNGILHCRCSQYYLIELR